MIVDRIDPPELLRIPEIVNVSIANRLARDPHLRSDLG